MRARTHVGLGPLRRFGVVDVAGTSMLPTLRPGDRLVVLYGAPARSGRVVVMTRPDRPELLVVKRAVRRLERGWWVAGDNPSESDDSRAFGVVPDTCVRGRVLFRWWPWRVTRPWQRTGAGGTRRRGGPRRPARAARRLRRR